MTRSREWVRSFLSFLSVVKVGGPTAQLREQGLRVTAVRVAVVEAVRQRRSTGGGCRNVVHAKGGGAFGHFAVTQHVLAFTRADFLQPGTTTEMIARFPTVAGELGSTDTARDPRGFGLKFYTDPGLRVGWVVAPPAVPVACLARISADLHTSTFTQRLLHAAARDTTRLSADLGRTCASYAGWAEALVRGVAFIPGRRVRRRSG